MAAGRASADTRRRARWTPSTAAATTARRVAAAMMTARSTSGYYSLSQLSGPANAPLRWLPTELPRCWPLQPSACRIVRASRQLRIMTTCTSVIDVSESFRPERRPIDDARTRIDDARTRAARCCTEVLSRAQVPSPVDGRSATVGGV